ncbi:MAG: MBL fold metallo-hydrolase, partial [Ruminiclostridium sp.]|nr:MBL fold metallo-hydrolase [Ruminiclostridium sp.]
MEAFPGKKVHAIIGGFHLFESPAHAVREFGKRLQETGVERVVTGHCTGLEAYDILKGMLGDKAQQMECGLVLEF